MPLDYDPVLTDAAAAAESATVHAAASTGALERLPKWLICIPLVIQWLYLSLRFGGATVPCAANPAITAGGMVGEGKLEYFHSMGALGLGATAPFAGLLNTGAIDDAAIATAMASSQLTFPLIAKPDRGLCGYGVCKIDHAQALRDYIAAFPIGEPIVLQRYLPQENEAGIFYARDPRTGQGTIIGLALRYFPHVVGDGLRTIGELIAANARLRRLQRSAAHTLTLDLQHIPAAGETVRLSLIGSTRVGGLYLDGAQLITPALVAAIDAIARDMEQFHFGRFDVRFDSALQLRAGVGFSIMEVNGAGSEAIQAWDPGTGLLQGFRTIFAKQRLLFEIGAANRQRGAPVIGLLALARLNAQQCRLLDAYPPSN
jgi:hypothetical protein